MKNGDMPAMPTPVSVSKGNTLVDCRSFGLTKREMIAMHLHAALLTSCDEDGNWTGNNAGAADMAWNEAGELVALFEKHETKESK